MNGKERIQSHRLSCATARSERRAFSLIELVIVIIIMGTVAAIALPRMSRAASGAEEAALQADFRALNNALEMYTVEHGIIPPVGNVAAQLTQYSTKNGTQTSHAPDAANGIIYGPYLVKIPAIPMGPKKGYSAIDDENGAKVGWIYQPGRRRIIPNMMDEAGTVPDRYKPTLDDVIGGTADTEDTANLIDG